ncbi:lipoprotein [Pseudomonas sp. MWU12-2323]|uniref:lipoprotein n=1 Tax=Pseudomonas sp. MWU12-2323 TaxID=2651296 RepID=UPI00128B762B|nr:lipoprotein [Pseudomonas sp. MWU12-2323]MPQ69401.1 conjugal transfer protein [Pseudomonas sp. MWU12-2323]
MKKPIFALAFLTLLSGCSSEPTFKNQASMDDIYNAVNGTAQRETVGLLREGLRARPELGSSEPYYPIRQADVVAPVWSVPYADKKTGIKHGGNWDYIVIEDAQWAD